MAVAMKDNDTHVKRLEKEIEDLSATISSLPKTIEEAMQVASHHQSSSSGDNQPMVDAGAVRLVLSRKYLQKDRWEKKYQVARLVEENRVARVVAEAEEAEPGSTTSLGSIVDKDCECLICLEVIPEPKSHVDKVADRFVCCGNFICIACATNRSTTSALETCPMCRNTLPRTDAEINAHIRTHAQSGKTWAQRDLAVMLNDGVGCRASMDQAAHWYLQAAEQGDSYSQCALGRFYLNGWGGLQQSDSEARRYFTLAAKQGSPESQYYIGKMCVPDGELDGDGPRSTEAVRWFTLSALQGYTEAQFFLGFLHVLGQGGLAKSQEAALSYFEKAALKGHTAAQGKMSKVLLGVATETYDGRYDMTGFSAVPRVLYWARKAAEAGDGESKGMVASMERNMMQSCESCHKTPQQGTNLKKCIRCRAVAFCGRECQRKNWSMGHKTDCVNYKKLDAQMTG